MQVMSQLQHLRCLKHKPNSQRKQHSSLRLAEAAAVAVVARAVVVLKGTADQQMDRLQVLSTILSHCSLCLHNAP